MMRCFLCLLGVLQLIDSGMSLSFMAESQDAATDTVNIQVVHSAHTREKRSTMQHPDILHLKFNFRGSEVQLNLTQKIRSAPNIPVYTDDGRSKVLQEDLPDNEKFAVFRDQPNGAVLIVEIVSEMIFHVAGNFYHENRMFKIWPQQHRIHKRTTDLEPDHNILPVKDISDMTKDVMSLDIDSMSGELLKKATAVREEKESAAVSTNSQRSVPGVARYIIEIGALPDYAIYSFFLKEAKFNSIEALANLRTFYSFLEDSIQLRYDTFNLQDPTISITCWIKFIQIAQTQEASQWIEIARNGTEIDLIGALGSVFEYTLNGSAIDTADHYMFFTGNNLLYGSFDPIAATYRGSLCTVYGFSLNEHFVNGRLGNVAAHELAHNLNSSHDGVEGGIKCNASDLFIMSPKLAFTNLANPSNQWFFSSCTIEMVKSFLAQPIASCASETAIAGGRSNGQDEGQVFNADAQCETEVGSGSVFCRSAYPDPVFGICQVLLCTGTNGSQSTCPRKRVPAEGTSCGNGEWCERGQCVPNAAAPPRVENCPQGDEAGANCRRSDCDTLTGFDLIRCCRTCAPFTPSVSVERYVIIVPFG